MATQAKAKTEPASNKPASAEDVVVEILESAIAFRGDRPNLSMIARLSNRAAGLLKLDQQERLAVENSAAIAVARKRGLLA